jgi:hypothetical protein
VVFPSYERFVEEVVLLRRQANAADRRLDGWLSGGNFAVAGVFEHAGRQWKVHEDSHYEPLLIAYEAMRGGDEQPFVEEPTKRGVSLNLRPELRAKMRTDRFKYLYIYET